MRLLLDSADVRSEGAVEIFCYRLAKYIASYVVPLGKVDAVIFTGGIGENSALIRSKVMEFLAPFRLKVLDNHTFIAIGHRVDRVMERS
jgi:acetate kinase